ncbi:MAG: L,D-transpeptidase [Chloroflexi bacterium]|nr:L,D-transpeptidase [Chloroflexota bacterium]
MDALAVGNGRFPHNRSGGITAVLLVTQWFMFASANRSPAKSPTIGPRPSWKQPPPPPATHPSIHPGCRRTAQPKQTNRARRPERSAAPRMDDHAHPPPTPPRPPPTLVPTYLAPQNNKPAMRPFGVAQGEPWIDVDLSSQTLNAYEGNDLVYTTRVSSGLNEFPTVTGMFRIWLRLESQTMDGTRLGYDYYLENVPYVMYFF